MNGSELIECIRSMPEEEQQQLSELLEKIRHGRSETALGSGMSGVEHRHFFERSLTENQAKEWERMAYLCDGR